MKQIARYHKPKFLTYCLPFATLLLNWWAACLCSITLIAMCFGTLYGLIGEAHSVWLSLLLSVIGGLLLHSAIIAISLAIAVTADVARAPYTANSHTQY